MAKSVPPTQSFKIPQPQIPAKAGSPPRIGSRHVCCWRARETSQAKKQNPEPQNPAKARFTPQQEVSASPTLPSTRIRSRQTRKYCSRPISGHDRTACGKTGFPYSAHPNSWRKVQATPNPKTRRTPGSPHSKKPRPPPPCRPHESALNKLESTALVPFRNQRSAGPASTQRVPPNVENLSSPRPKIQSNNR